MKVAVITGASSGMGKEFALQIKAYFPELEEIWAIARGKQGLEALQRQVQGLRVRGLSLDITRKAGLWELQERLKEEKPEICALVCSAGMGIQKRVEDTALEGLTAMTELNCTALTGVTKCCLPYCIQGSRIFLLASAAGFLPQPGFAVYAASKAYVLSFARALGQELSGKLTITAVCPGPVRTPFLEKMGGVREMPAYKKRFLASPEAVVRKALKDGKKGRKLSVYGVSMKALQLGAKLLPHSFLMRFMK